jgi:hypothetical protein
MTKLTPREYKMYLLGYGDGQKHLRIRKPHHIEEVLAMKSVKLIPMQERPIHEKRPTDTVSLDVLDA